MALTPVYYGSFNINDGINYVVTKRTVPFPSINPSMFKIGRLEGMKKVGESINERKLTIEGRVIAVSRADLENKLDALQAAFFIRGQNLNMHTNDQRYFIADCIEMQFELGPGNVIHCPYTAIFQAYTPFAFSPTQSVVTSGINTMIGGGVNLGAQLTTFTYSVVGGGNVYTRPVIRIYQRTPACAMTLTGTTLVVGQINGTISCTATPQLLNIGDDIILSSGTHTQSVVVAATTPSGATSVQVGGFAPNFAYAAGTTLTRDLTWNTVQVNQTLDQQALIVSTSLPAAPGDYLDVNCDPLQTNGYTAILNGGNTISTVAGSFAALQPTSTPYTFSIFSNSIPQIEVVWTFTSRWLS
jgi:hypothetical protein